MKTTHFVCWSDRRNSKDGSGDGGEGLRRLESSELLKVRARLRCSCGQSLTYSALGPCLASHPIKRFCSPTSFLNQHLAPEWRAGLRVHVHRPLAFSLRPGVDVNSALQMCAPQAGFMIWYVPSFPHLYSLCKDDTTHYFIFWYRKSSLSRCRLLAPLT